jgi:hypothetical protein
MLKACEISRLPTFPGALAMKETRSSRDGRAAAEAGAFERLAKGKTR